MAENPVPAPADAEPLPLRDEMIRLGQALKLANLVEDGVEAKAVVSEGLVSVNGEPETRRGRQLKPGDWLSLGESAVVIEREQR
ncbi:RNA-binding S4 domain-containing protein [Arthrobacter sp. UM1]|uniref:RNA-binding S4 domain-containing protein n=1 Tax=Arthrobacter sp. UM1 TaxID=2766776 RepID=UPI001CF67F71|nr:RNA-binding S4 domain-containing protein [Arthrobacter sp. UM1]MCB4208046.1 RNA-binding S4 domain-containing protein [Arthrobacter sp. UM1]